MERNKLLAELDDLEKKIDQIIINFESRSQLSHAYREFQSFKRELEQFFDRGPEFSTDQELEKITMICRKANENDTIQDIIYFYESKPVHTEEDQEILFSKNESSNIPVVTAYNPIPYNGNPIEEEKVNTNDLIIEKTHKTEINKAHSIQEGNNHEILRKYKELLEQSYDYYQNEHIIDKAMACYRTLKTIEEEHSVNPKLYKMLQEEKEKYVTFIHKLVSAYDYMNRCLAEISSEGWIHEVTTKGITVHYKLPPGVESISVKAEAVLNCPVERMISMIYQIDLTPLWLPFCKVGKELKQLSKASKIVYNKFCPPIVSDRETYMVGEGVDRISENGTIIVMGNSFTEDIEFQKTHNVEIPKTSKAVIVEIHSFILEVFPIDLNKCRIVQMINMNPKLKGVPMKFINFFTRKFGVKILTGLVKRCTKNFDGSPWDKAIKDPKNKVFYDWIQKKIRTYFKPDENEIKL